MRSQHLGSQHGGSQHGGNGQLSLLTDLYQLTMAYALWCAGRHERQAAFHLFTRRNPFRSGFTVAAGLESMIEFIDAFGFSDDDLDFLATLVGNDDRPLFSRQFLDYLRELSFTCDVDAVVEGTTVFPFEPLVRVVGPIAQCQILETPLLNFINFQTLIATKAARLCQAAQGEPIIDFGLRRAQGIDGALSATRAAFIGGCSGTSNLLAGRLYDIPVRGTHGHSWVLAFDSELEAFESYADALPNNCVFLVDTFDTLEGVHNAVRAARKLVASGQKLAGIRLDSGDLAYLSKEARKILDQAGFEQTPIFASNDLDEHVINSLKQQGAAIAVWGVGTKLVTGHDDAALGGVFKLAAIQDANGSWEHKVKLSEQALKISNPGIQQVRRFSSKGEFVADMIFDLELGAGSPATIVDPGDMTRRKTLGPELSTHDLLAPIYRGGEKVYETPRLEQTREFAAQQLIGFHEGVKRLIYPHTYPVGLERQLFDLRQQLILEARGIQGNGHPTADTGAKLQGDTGR